jgi:hypothetical protein
MADTLDQLHLDAGLGLLRADTGPPPLLVYPDPEGEVPAEISPPYVRVYTSIERPADGQANALDGRSVTWTVHWYAHCVGANEYAATAVAMRVNRALLDITPVIAGRVCSMIRQEASQPTQRDESTGTAVYDRVDVYAMTSAPG